MKRGFLLFLGAVIMASGLSAQNVNMNDELIKLESLQELKLPDGYRLKALPYTHDNTVSPYFPEVFMQTGWSCNQASSIGYVFTYEINALRDVASNQKCESVSATGRVEFLK